MNWSNNHQLLFSRFLKHHPSMKFIFEFFSILIALSLFGFIFFDLGLLIQEQVDHGDTHIREWLSPCINLLSFFFIITIMFGIISRVDKKLTNISSAITQNEQNISSAITQNEQNISGAITQNEQNISGVISSAITQNEQNISGVISGAITQNEDNIVSRLSTRLSSVNTSVEQDVYTIKIKRMISIIFYGGFFLDPETKKSIYELMDYASFVDKKELVVDLLRRRWCSVKSTMVGENEIFKHVYAYYRRKYNNNNDDVDGNWFLDEYRTLIPNISQEIIIPTVPTESIED